MSNYQKTRALNLPSLAAELHNQPVGGQMEGEGIHYDSEEVIPADIGRLVIIPGVEVIYGAIRSTLRYRRQEAYRRDPLALRLMTGSQLIRTKKGSSQSYLKRVRREQGHNFNQFTYKYLRGVVTGITNLGSYSLAASRGDSFKIALKIRGQPDSDHKQLVNERRLVNGRLSGNQMAAQTLLVAFMLASTQEYAEQLLYDAKSAFPQMTDRTVEIMPLDLLPVKTDSLLTAD
jgi:hypothetical protein